MILRIIFVIALHGAPFLALRLKHTLPQEIVSKFNSNHLNDSKAEMANSTKIANKTNSTNGTSQLPNSTHGVPPVPYNQILNDEALKVDGQLVIPLTSDGHFQFSETIKVVFIDVGPFTKCDFTGELKNDPTLLVIGIEANPDMIHQQEFQHDRYKLFNFAAGYVEGVTTLQVTAEPACSSVMTPNPNFVGSLIPPWVKENCTRPVRNVTVPMRRLDKFFDRIPNHITIGWLKTDCQGYDIEVIRSAEAKLTRVQKIQYEIQDVPLESNRNMYINIPSFQAVNQYVMAMGFPTPMCSTTSPTQDVLHEFDCVSCRTVVPGQCYRKEL